MCDGNANESKQRNIQMHWYLKINYVLVGVVIVSWRCYQSRDIYPKQNDINREEYLLFFKELQQLNTSVYAILCIFSFLGADSGCGLIKLANYSVHLCTY